MSYVTDLANIYGVEAETVYHAAQDGNDLEGVPAAALASIATPLLGIMNYSDGTDDADGADAYAGTAQMRVQAQGDDGIATISHGDKFSISGDLWGVTDAHKGPKGLEWICEIGRIYDTE